MKESQFTSDITREANETLSRLNDRLLVCSIPVDDPLLDALSVAEAKLTGLLDCQEPDATHVRVVLDGVRRTRSLVAADFSDVEKRREVLSILWTKKLSLKSTSIRVNEIRNALADKVEENAAAVDDSLLEFYGAAVLAYVGALILCGLLLREAVHSGHSTRAHALLVFALPFCSANWLMEKIRKIGIAAKSTVESARSQVKFTRETLLDLE